MPVISLVPHKPYPIAGIASSYQGFTVQNQGITTVYFSQLQTINPDLLPPIYDYSLPPGGIINWPSDEPCFVAIKATDLVGTISYAPLVADQSGASAGGTVSIVGTVTAAIPAGVTVNGGDIAITGTVNADITSGTVDIGTISGPVALDAGTVVLNQNQNAPTLLASGTIVFAGGTGTTNILSTNMTGLSAYASLIIVCTGGFSAFQALAAGNYLKGVFNFEVGGAATAKGYTPQWILDTVMQEMIQVPVVSDQVSFLIQAIKSIAGSGGSITYSIYGSSEVISTPLYVSDSTTLIGGLGTEGAYTAVAAIGTPITQFLASKNGHCHIEAFGSSGASTGVMDLSYCDTGALVFFAQSVIAAASPQEKDALFPMLPIELSLTCTAGATTIASFVQE